MELTKQIRFDLDDDLYDWVTNSCPEGKRAELIREALNEKRNRKKISDDAMAIRMKKIDQLDTQAVHKSVVDVDFTTQTIYEEIKKQNEILKLIHRRVTFSSVFSRHILDEYTRSTKLSETLEKTVVNLIESEKLKLDF